MVYEFSFINILTTPISFLNKITFADYTWFNMIKHIKSISTDTFHINIKENYTQEMFRIFHLPFL